MALAVFQRTITDGSGNTLSGASVEVRKETVGTPLATLYSDRDGNTSESNPVTADSDGFVRFYVEAGAYKIAATSGSLSITWRHVAIGTAAEVDTPIPIASGGTGQTSAAAARNAITGVYDVSDPTYGAALDGTTDDTSAINDAITAANDAGGGDVIISGDALVSATTNIEGADEPAAIVMKSNVRLIFTNNAQVTLEANEFIGYQIIHCDDISNFSIINAHLTGDKDTHTASPSSGEWGHCIRLDGCTDFLIEGGTLEKGWGDGIYVGAGDQGYCHKGRIVEVDCDDNRRQGMSIISADDLKVTDSRFTNTSGTAPEAGIDIEPNGSTERLREVRIIDCHFEGNNSAGVLMFLRPLRSTSEPVDIVLRGLHSYQDLYGIHLNKCGVTSDHVRGRIHIDSPYVELPHRAGIRVAQWDPEGPEVVIDDAVIYDPAEDGPASLGAADTCGISLFRDSSDSDGIGNISVNRPIVHDRRSSPKIEYAIYINDFPATGTPDRILVRDPVRLTGATISDFWNDEGADIIDTHRASVRDADSDLTVEHTPHYPTFQNSNATATRTITLGENMDVGTRLVFEVTGDQTLRIDLESVSPSQQILQLTSAADKYIEGEQGARVVLRKISDLLWMPLEVTGTWTEEA